MNETFTAFTIATPTRTIDGTELIPLVVPSVPNTQQNTLANVSQYILNQVRTKLASPTSYYVSTTGSDITGNGSSGLPWATIQHAANYVFGQLDLSGNNVNIMLANGTYAAGVTISSPQVGAGTVAGSWGTFLQLATRHLPVRLATRLTRKGKNATIIITSWERRLTSCFEAKW